jgi:hypothetical protein
MSDYYDWREDIDLDGWAEAMEGWGDGPEDEAGDEPERPDESRD